MSLYRVNIVEYSKEADDWGAFHTTKEFDIFRVEPSNGKKNKEIKEGVYGFVVQHVSKKTDVSVLCGDGLIREVSNIDKFTSNQVTHMNHSYTELFPVLEGETVIADRFQNGALLRYEQENSNGKWYANDNPPTSGKIIIEGTIYFIPAEKDEVNRVINYSSLNEKNKNKNNNINSPTKIKIFGSVWDLSPDKPAAGLPYTTATLPSLAERRQSNVLKHTVEVGWNGIKKKFRINEHMPLKNLSECSLVDEEDIPKRGIKSKISHEISSLAHI